MKKSIYTLAALITLLIGIILLLNNYGLFLIFTILIILLILYLWAINIIYPSKRLYSQARIRIVFYTLFFITLVSSLIFTPVFIFYSQPPDDFKEIPDFELLAAFKFSVEYLIHHPTIIWTGLQSLCNINTPFHPIQITTVSFAGFGSIIISCILIFHYSKLKFPEWVALVGVVVIFLFFYNFKYFPDKDKVNTWIIKPETEITPTRPALRSYKHECKINFNQEFSDSTIEHLELLLDDSVEIARISNNKHGALINKKYLSSNRITGYIKTKFSRKVSIDRNRLGLFRTQVIVSFSSIYIEFKDFRRQPYQYLKTENFPNFFGESLFFTNLILEFPKNKFIASIPSASSNIALPNKDVMIFKKENIALIHDSPPYKLECYVMTYTNLKVLKDFINVQSDIDIFMKIIIWFFFPIFLIVSTFFKENMKEWAMNLFYKKNKNKEYGFKPSDTEKR